MICNNAKAKQTSQMAGGGISFMVSSSAKRRGSRSGVKRGPYAKRFMPPLFLQMLFNLVKVVSGARRQIDLSIFLGFKADTDGSGCAENFARSMRLCFSLQENAHGNDSGRVSPARFIAYCNRAAEKVSDPVHKKLLHDFRTFARLVKAAPAEIFAVKNPENSPIELAKWNNKLCTQVAAAAQGLDGILHLVNLFDDYDKQIHKRMVNSRNFCEAAARPGDEVRVLEIEQQKLLGLATLTGTKALARALVWSTPESELREFAISRWEKMTRAEKDVWQKAVVRLE